MAQLRQDFERFERRDSVIVVVAPEDRETVRDYWQTHDLPFIGLADPEHTVAELYGQQVHWLKLGRMPALVVIDRAGRVYYQHKADSMRDIPPNESVLALIDEINEREVEAHEDRS